ncbi:MAG TPA: elongation factor G, partial [Anaerolineae bacterium]|nr:elongation factor G [Anaerolineae bacterium]
MKEYTTEYLRNIALVAHGGAGKTMMAEAFLYFTGAITRLGKVEDGTTVSDYDEEEIRRTISLYTSVAPIEYRDHKINLLDAPGFTDFVGEMISALSVADSAMVLIDSVAGIEVGTEIAWRHCDTFKLPRFVVINKMDRENADFAKTYQAVDQFAQANDARVVKVQLPWGEKLDFKGVIDLISMKAYSGDGKSAQDIPAELKDDAEEARMVLIEAAAEGEDALLEKYLETGELTQDELLRGLKNVVQSGTYIPVFVAAAGHEKGVGPLLSAIVDLMPNPAQRPSV